MGVSNYGVKKLATSLAAIAFAPLPHLNDWLQSKPGDVLTRRPLLYNRLCIVYTTIHQRSFDENKHG